MLVTPKDSYTPVIFSNHRKNYKYDTMGYQQ